MLELELPHYKDERQPDCTGNLNKPTAPKQVTIYAACTARFGRIGQCQLSNGSALNLQTLNYYFATGNASTLAPPIIEFRRRTVRRAHVGTLQYATLMQVYSDVIDNECSEVLAAV